MIDKKLRVLHIAETIRGGVSTFLPKDLASYKPARMQHLAVKR
jgi:hypothetical protein